MLAGDIPKEQADDLGIIVSVWLNPSVAEDENLDHKILFDINRETTAKAIHKAMTNEPSIDWLQENQDQLTHKYYQMGLDGKILSHGDAAVSANCLISASEEKINRRLNLSSEG